MSEEPFEDGVLLKGGARKYDEDENNPVVVRGLTAGRAINGCIIFNYFLVLLTALIVSGTLGVLNDKLARHHPDTFPDNHTCILFSSFDTKTTKIQYNNSGVCNFIVGGFALIAFAALAYIIVSIIRVIFSTDIWMTVVVDILANLGLVVIVLVMGITLSLGLAVTCGEVNKFYRSSGLGNCSARTIPDVGGYKFYREVNISQGAAWFCFMFTVFGLGVFLVRSCIFCRRRATIPSMPHGAEILTAEDNYEDDEANHCEDNEKPPKAI